MIELAKIKCCGCFACAAVCPVLAVTSRINNGFIYPNFDKTVCINCHKCEQVCPQFFEQKIAENAKSAICRTNEESIRNISSSGGVFYELALNIIEKRGTVYGAAYNKIFSVEHIRVTDKNELKRLCTSKYVQSDIHLGMVYRNVSEDLNNGINVLFSWTPCQVTALKNFLKIIKCNISNLMTVSIICHGVSSPVVFDAYKKYLEEKYSSHISNINMREKHPSWHRYSVNVRFNNSATYSKMHELDPYYRLFLDNKTLRESCFECQCKGILENADFIIGDAWGFEKRLPGIFDNKGHSLVITISQKAKNLLNELPITSYDYDIANTIETHHSLYSSASKPKDFLPDLAAVYNQDFFKSFFPGWMNLIKIHAKLFLERIKVIDLLRKKI